MVPDKGDDCVFHQPGRLHRVENPAELCIHQADAGVIRAAEVPDRGVVGGDLDVAGLDTVGGGAVRDVEVADPLLLAGGRWVDAAAHGLVEHRVVYVAATAAATV